MPASYQARLQSRRQRQEAVLSPRESAGEHQRWQARHQTVALHGLKPKSHRRRSAPVVGNQRDLERL